MRAKAFNGNGHVGVLCEAFLSVRTNLVGEYGLAYLFAPALDIQHGFAVVKEHGLLDSKSISAIDLLPLREKHFWFPYL